MWTEQSPIIPGVIALLYGAVLLLVCPKKLRHITVKEGEITYDGGYYASFNWSVTSIVITPLLVYYFVSFSNQLPLTLKYVQETGLMISSDSSITRNLSQELITWMHRIDWVGFPLIFLFTVLINLYDYFSYYRDQDLETGKTKYQDWTVAFQMHPRLISKKKNLTWNFFAYILQFFIILFGLLFFYRFSLVLGKIISLVSGPEPTYEILVNLRDPLGQMGLWPLNGLLEIYITIVLLVGFYLVLLRFIHMSRGVKWGMAPRLIILGVIGAIIVFLVIPYVVLKTDLDKKVMRAKVEMVEKIHRAEIAEKETGTLAAGDPVKLVKEITLISSQSFLPLNKATFYFFLTLLVLLLRLVIRPPKSIVDLVYEITGAKKA